MPGGSRNYRSSRCSQRVHRRFRVEFRDDRETLPGLGSLLGEVPDRAVRVLWAGIEAPTSLELLQDRVETRAEELGFAGEGVIFRPHVTIGRVREGERIPRADSDRLFAAPLSSSFTAERVVLYGSTMRDGGSEYRELHTAAFKG